MAGPGDKTNEWKILQLLPAAGWCSEQEDADGTLYVEPVIAWALAEIPASSHGGPLKVVTGIMSSGEDIQSTMFCEAGSKFKRYLYLPDETHASLLADVRPSSPTSASGSTVTVYVNGVPEEREYDLEEESAPGRVGGPKMGRERMIPRLQRGEKRTYANGRWEIRRK